MKMSEKKIIFLDLDGTLLNDEKNIPDVNKEWINRALAGGHYVALASGRAIASIQKIINELHMKHRPGCYVIAYNGAQIYDMEQEKQIRNLSIPAEYARYLYREADRAGYHIHTYADQYILAERMSPELDVYMKESGTPCILEDRETSFKRDIPKVLLERLDDHEGLVRFRKEHSAWQQGKCVCCFSDPRYLEYSPIGADKGSAVKFLCQYLQLPEENTIACGNEENDLSMIRTAHTGVAMKNAVSEIKTAAGYITGNDNNHGGVAEAIQRFMMQPDR